MPCRRFRHRRHRISDGRCRRRVPDPDPNPAVWQRTSNWRGASHSPSAFRPCWSASPLQSRQHVRGARPLEADVVTMAGGSIVGTFIGGRMLGIVPEGILLPALSAILTISAFKTWRGRETSEESRRSDSDSTGASAHIRASRPSVGLRCLDVRLPLPSSR